MSNDTPLDLVTGAFSYWAVTSRSGFLTQDTTCER
jgi:hypothetical protein